jgi:hypothetical protein
MVTLSAVIKMEKEEEDGEKCLVQTFLVKRLKSMKGKRNEIT